LTLRSLRTALALVLSLTIGVWMLPVAQAQEPLRTPRQNLWTTNGSVTAIQQVGNTIYLGGGFTYVGPVTGNGVPLSVSDGTPPASFPQVLGFIRTVVADGTGGWYIGGDFTQVGNSPRNRLAHILADNTLWQ
jgi:hypothetical protein